MTFIKFPHANKTTPIFVVREHVWNVYYSDAHAAVHIVSIAGAIVPVAVTVDEALLMLSTNSNKEEEKKNG